MVLTQKIAYLNEVGQGPSNELLYSVLSIAGQHLGNYRSDELVQLSEHVISPDLKPALAKICLQLTPEIIQFCERQCYSPVVPIGAAMCVNKNRCEFIGADIRTNKESNLCIIGDVITFTFLSGHQLHCILERIWTENDRCYLDLHFLLQIDSTKALVITQTGTTILASELKLGNAGIKIHRPLIKFPRKESINFQNIVYKERAPPQIITLILPENCMAITRFLDSTIGQSCSFCLPQKNQLQQEMVRIHALNYTFSDQSIAQQTVQMYQNHGRFSNIVQVLGEIRIGINGTLIRRQKSIPAQLAFTQTNHITLHYESLKTIKKTSPSPIEHTTQQTSKQTPDKVSEQLVQSEDTDQVLQFHSPKNSSENSFYSFSQPADRSFSQRKDIGTQSDYVDTPTTVQNSDQQCDTAPNQLEKTRRGRKNNHAQSSVPLINFSNTAFQSLIAEQRFSLPPQTAAYFDKLLINSNILALNVKASQSRKQLDELAESHQTTTRTSNNVPSEVLSIDEQKSMIAQRLQFLFSARQVLAKNVKSSIEVGKCCPKVVHGTSKTLFELQRQFHLMRSEEDLRNANEARNQYESQSQQIILELDKMRQIGCAFRERLSQLDAEMSELQQRAAETDAMLGSWEKLQNDLEKQLEYLTMQKGQPDNQFNNDTEALQLAIDIQQLSDAQAATVCCPVQNVL